MGFVEERVAILTTCHIDKRCFFQLGKHLEKKKTEHLAKIVSVVLPSVINESPSKVPYGLFLMVSDG